MNLCVCVLNLPITEKSAKWGKQHEKDDEHRLQKARHLIIEVVENHDIGQNTFNVPLFLRF